MNKFLGREYELELLNKMLRRVTHGDNIGRPGKATLIRGRRRVGKSRLAEEFIERSGLPSLFFTASGRSRAEDLDLFTQAVLESDLPEKESFGRNVPGSWDQALSLLAAALPPDQPAIVVLDELPYLIRADPGFEGTLQRMFDRQFSRRQVLLLLVGSDLAMMERLSDYDRPFHQRATEMVVPPLSPAAVASRLDLPPADAFDAFLITGGLPIILNEWPRGSTMIDYLGETFTNPVSALLVSADQSLAAEFPVEAQAEKVLRAIGSGERVFSLIARAAGDLAPGSLNRSLQLLIKKRLVEAATPLSTKPSRETRYLITDPYLRFWFTFLDKHLTEIARQRGDLVMARVEASWTSWRGRAIEPVIRESLRRLSTDVLPEGTASVGGYWTRTNDPEIDLVGADREPVAKEITMVGSIKWLENKPFDSRDLARLAVHRSQLPGATEDTPMFAVSRAGGQVDGVRVLTPGDLLAAWTQNLRGPSGGSPAAG